MPRTASGDRRDHENIRRPAALLGQQAAAHLSEPAHHDVVSETWGDLPKDEQPRTGDTANRVVGKENLTRAISDLLGGATHVTTVHHGHMPEIELTSDTTARGIWAMEDELWWTNGDHEEHLHGYGHYHEEYRKEDGRWLISYRKLTRLREEKTPAFYEFLGRQ